MTRQKRVKLKRIVATFDDKSELTFDISPRSWSLSVRRDFDSKGGSSGYIEHVGLPSGSVTIEAAFTSSTYTAGATPQPKRAGRKSSKATR